MKIAKIQTPKAKSFHLQGQKISLTKLSNSKPQINMFEDKQLQKSHQNQIEKQKISSHIKWVDNALAIDNNPMEKNNSADCDSQQKSTMKSGRRKIFDEKSRISMKSNTHIPTFSKVPIDDNSLPVTQQIPYPSISLKSRIEKKDEFKNSSNTGNISPSFSKQTDSLSHLVKKTTFGYYPASNHQQRQILQPIEKKQIEGRKISFVEQELNQKIKQIEEQRLKRLQKMQKQNQKLYQNLKYHNHRQPEFDSNPNTDYYFNGPVVFPSKDWPNEQQIVMPMTQRLQKNEINWKYDMRQSLYKTEGVQASSSLQKKTKQISLMNFTKNRIEPFNMDNNAFREIMSPLEFQGENQF